MTTDPHPWFDRMIIVLFVGLLGILLWLLIHIEQVRIR